MAWMCWLVTAVCVGVYVVPWRRWVKEDDVAFSGTALHEGKVWVWATATLIHRDLAHLVNNMLHFAVYAPALEQITGPEAFLALFLLTGASGWAFGYAINRSHQDWSNALQFVTSIGSSPATYGLAFLLACRNPGLHVGHNLSALWLVSLYSIPFLLRHDAPRQPLWKAASGIVMAYLFTSSVVLRGRSLTAASSLFFYLIHTFVWRLETKRAPGAEFTTTDHKSHTGGVLMGCFLSLWYGPRVGDPIMMAMNIMSGAYIVFCMMADF